jgi:acyl carrier protein
LTAEASRALKIITELVERLEKSHEGMTAQTPLFGGGLGLDSLEAAELSAALEDTLGSDPFSAGEDPKTVGDVLAFYEPARRS